MLIFAIIRHPEVILPKTPEGWIPYYQHLYKPSISLKGRKDAIRIAKTVDKFIKKYVSQYVYGNVYHSQTLRCRQMSQILAKHGPFKKSIFEPGLSDPPQAWLLHAVKAELSGEKSLNHEWWMDTPGMQDTKATVKTEPPKKAWRRVTRAIDKLAAQNAQDAQNVVIGLVLPSIVIQMLVGYLTGIDPAITTAKFPFDKASLTLVTENGKLLCSNVKL